VPPYPKKAADCSVRQSRVAAACRGTRQLTCPRPAESLSCLSAANEWQTQSVACGIASPTMTISHANLSNPFLSTRQCRLWIFVCSLLILWASVDSQFLLLVAPGSVSPTCPGSSPLQPDDDDMFDQTGAKTSLRSWRRNTCPPLPVMALGRAVQEHCLDLPVHHRDRLTFPVCEHEYRNGIGAPLLC
jgi:hypothetical protein